MAVAAMATLLKIGANSVAELTSISGLSLTADTIDTTALDSTGGYRTFIRGMKDAGEVTISGFFNPADTNGQYALYDAFEDGEVLNLSVVFPSTMGAEWTFTGIVTAFSTGSDVDDAVTFDATIKVSGQPNLGVTASAGLSALSLSGTGGTISPAFNNGIYSYSFDGVTAASVTVTATAASHELLLYVDGVFVEELTSASASAAIAMAVGSKKLTILAKESGKTTKTYEIVVIKVS